MINLFSILFEQAKTPKEAIKADLGLFVALEEDETATVILLSVERCEAIVNAYGKLDGNVPTPPPPVAAASTAVPVTSTGTYDPNLPPWVSEDASSSAKQVWLQKALANRAIVGGLQANHNDGQLWRVAYSIAVEKYGPMLYETMMGLIYPAYLRSDFSLTSASQTIWNKMLLRKDVEARSVVDLGAPGFVSSFNVADLKSPEARAAERDHAKYAHGGIPAGWFEKFLATLPESDKEKLGPFYGFRKKSGKNLGKYNKLINAGNEVVGMFATTLGLTETQVETAILDAGVEMFRRFYNEH